MKNYKLTKSDIKEISKKVTAVIGRQFGVSYEFNVNGDSTPLRFAYGNTIEELTSYDCDKMEIKICKNLDPDCDYDFCEVERINNKWIVT